MADYHERITRMYEEYAPDKVGRVPQFLAANAGREEEVLEKLIEKYGPEPLPVAPPASTLPSPPVNSQIPATPVASPSAPIVQGQAQGSVPHVGPIDPMHDLRWQVKQDCGFLTREHELMWEDAWMGKMPLGTLRKTWDLNRSVLLAGLGNKMSSHARPVRRWQKRFFVLAPPFLYYFNADQPTAICKGALYLDRATITDEPLNGVNAITILSRVTKKPLELDRRGDYSTFIIGFDTEKQHGTWLNMLKQVSIIGDVGAAAKSFGAYPMSGPNMLTMMANSSNVMSPMVSGSDQQSQQALAAVAMLGSSNQPMQAPLGMTQAQFQQHQMQQLSSMGVTPQFVAAATNPGSPLRGHITHPLFNNFAVDAPEIKRRIARLSRDRDPVKMAEVFLQFVQDHVENAQLLWRLMSSLEEIEPFSGPTYTQAQMFLNNTTGSYGYGPGAQHAMPQQALVSAHRHLFGTGSGGDMDTQSQSQYLLMQEQQRQLAGSGFGVALNSPNSSQMFGGDASGVNARSLADQLQRAEPSSAVLRAAASHPPLPQQVYATRYDSPPRGLTNDDDDWQRRIGRIRDRKHLVDRLMKDLPQH